VRDLKWSRPPTGIAASSIVPRFFAKNRRDGARLLSSALVICGGGLVRVDHPIGQLVVVLAGVTCLYWWHCYRQLTS